MPTDVAMPTQIRIPLAVFRFGKPLAITVEEAETHGTLIDTKFTALMVQSSHSSSNRAITTITNTNSSVSNARIDSAK